MTVSSAVSLGAALECDASVAVVVLSWPVFMTSALLSELWVGSFHGN